MGLLLCLEWAVCACFLGLLIRRSACAAHQQLDPLMETILAALLALGTISNLQPMQLAVLVPADGARYTPSDSMIIEYVVSRAEMRRCGPNATILLWFQHQAFGPLRDTR